MHINNRTRTWALSALIAVVALALLVFVWGSRRYDGPGNFLLRISAEVEARRPHPEFVPTPLPAAQPDIAMLPQIASPTETLRLATETPPPTATATAAPAKGRLQTAPSTAAQSSAAPVRAFTATPIPVATPPPAPDLPPRVQLAGLRHNWQTWNNCGPATLAMNLSYFGSKLSQADVAATLRPYRDDKNVNPDEMAGFARAQGLNALVRVNGDAERVKRLLAADVPVLIETWYEPKPNDGMGHYRLLTGYDDAAREWIAYDSYDGRGLKKGDPYAGIRLPYDEVGRLWEVFNRTHVILYDDARAAEVAAILGEDADDAAMWARALRSAVAAGGANPKDPFAWFNAGSSLVALGRHEEASLAFDQARRIGLPWRMLWYQFTPFEAYYETGRYDEVIALADATLRNAQIEELYTWRGRAQRAKGDLSGARASFERAVQLNPGYAAAATALRELSSAAP